MNILNVRTFCTRTFLPNTIQNILIASASSEACGILIYTIDHYVLLHEYFFQSQLVPINFQRSSSLIRARLHESFFSAVRQSAAFGPQTNSMVLLFRDNKYVK